jgi:hypothetical protein
MKILSKKKIEKLKYQKELHLIGKYLKNSKVSRLNQEVLLRRKKVLSSEPKLIRSITTSTIRAV